MGSVQKLICNTIDTAGHFHRAQIIGQDINKEGKKSAVLTEPRGEGERDKGGQNGRI